MILDDMLKTIREGIPATWTTANSFASYLPDEPDDALMVSEYGGDPEYLLGGASYSLEDVQIQVLVRSASYATARTRIEAVRSLLSALGSTTINGVRYLRVMSKDSPHDIGPDPADRVRIVANFRATKEPS